jgi:MFS superfamily sulfate permease-like transporter
MGALVKRFENLLLPQNILSSLVVFVIAVPLSLGIALGSGMPPTSALVGAVAGGIIIGILSGAPLVVSGPAAGLSALVLTYVQQFGVGAIYRITILLGFAQILFGLFRLGKIINKIPKPVLEGVLSAIGLVILLGQLHVLMGQKMPGSPTANVLGVPASFVGSITNQPTGSLPAFLFGGAALLIQLFWGRLFPRLRGIPAALPACLVVTLVSLPFDGVPRVHIDSILQHMANESASMWVLSSWADWKLWLGAVVGLSVVASAESLLTARAIQIVAQNKNLPTKILSC